MIVRKLMKVGYISKRKPGRMSKSVVVPSGWLDLIHDCLGKDVDYVTIEYGPDYSLLIKPCFDVAVPDGQDSQTEGETCGRAG